jgi:hypothetical protein
VVPDVDVLAGRPRDRAPRLLHRRDRRRAVADLGSGQHPVDVRALGEVVTRLPSASGLAEVEHQALADQRVEDLAG